MFTPLARYAAATAGAALVFANIGSAVHFGLIRHDVCPEHGEVIHAEATEAAPAAADPTSAALTAGAATTGRDHATDHCGTTVIQRERPTLGVVASAAPYPPHAIRSRSNPQAVLPPRLAGYRLAPKNSPPL